MASQINVKIAPLPRGDYSSSATYAKLDVVSYNGSSYMAIKAVPMGTVPTNTTYWQVLAEKPTIGDGSITTNMLADGAVTADKLDSSVSEVYAEVDGNYENMTVGSAEQLLSTQYDTDSVPYAFRKSPYGDREFDEIHGGTIAWNQLANENTTVTLVKGTTRKKSEGMPVGSSVISGHKYLFRAEYSGVSNFSANYGVGTSLFTNENGTNKTVNSITQISNGLYEQVFSSAYNATADGSTSGSGNLWLYFVISSSEPSDSATVTISHINLIDLTQMFGSTVADAIYAMEQSTTGSGVAFFRGLFSKSYYAYNAGQLISVSGLSAHKMTGFNQFDKDNATIYYAYLNGKNWLQAADSRSIAIKCLPNTQYYVYTKGVAPQVLRIGSTDAASLPATPTSGGWGVRLDKAFASYGGLTGGAYTTEGTSKWLIVQASSATFTDFVSNLCINISGDRNGEFEPYEVHSYALDDSLTLRGVPRLVDNKMQFDGDIYSSDGTVQRRYGIVDLGTLSWTTIALAHGNAFRASVNGIKPNKNSSSIANVVCNKYPQVTYSDLGTTDKTYTVIWASSTASGQIYFRDDSYNDENVFASAMSGVYLVYALATPTTESASPYVNPQICNEYGTEEYISAEQSGVTMIVGHNTKYPQNLRKKIEGLPWNFSSLIAPNEATNKASQNYTVGSYLIMNNTLYKVTSAIANGGTITVGTNVTATTIMAEILAL